MNAAQGVPPFALPMLLSGYGQVVGQSPLQPSAFIPPFLSMPAPAAMFGVMQPIAGAGYARAGGLAPYSNEAWLGNLFGGDQSREGARMERVLRSDPFARAAFEQAIGGRIIDFGREGDGRIAVQRMAANPYAQALGGGALSPIASQLGGLYQQMNEGVGMARNGGLLGQSPFEALALSGFANMANQLIAAAGGGGGASGMPPLFGTGQGSWNRLRRRRARSRAPRPPTERRRRTHSAQVNSILNDPSLTMEDKIMLSLMCICREDGRRHQAPERVPQQAAEPAGRQEGRQVGREVDRHRDQEARADDPEAQPAVRHARQDHGALRSVGQERDPVDARLISLRRRYAGAPQPALRPPQPALRGSARASPTRPHLSLARSGSHQTVTSGRGDVTRVAHCPTLRDA
jgi:hypothetical protein